MAIEHIRAAVLVAAGLFVSCASQVQHEDREPPVTAQDSTILEAAMSLLPDEDHWNRHDNRECPPAATQLSLFCALQQASIQVLGKYDHRRAALQEVRFAIEAVTNGREFEHRLMDFNNLAETSLEDIHRVLNIAKERVESRLRAGA
jgi:hypothetical protein